MKQEFSFDGATYSENKADFKKILRKHGLKWKGSMGDFVWMSESDKIIAEFERDVERDITLSATLTWSGKKKTEFLKDFTSWAKEVGGKREKEPEKKKSPDRKIQKELEFWDSMYKPDEERLRMEGRPETWIGKDMKDWRKKRRQKRKELLEKYG